ncbi:recombination-associated protein RdgC [Pantoea sp. CCBC3-3-1]|uniref:recombination-associated protein RdgC n=1 Tax=Pantoea sp. CCBC3-3-1 TaxID=2490851 RepID=UPI0011BE4586|nr:recombination-associated protein RdgC [Pantoea sp. CCBC3-3-1]
MFNQYRNISTYRLNRELPFDTEEIETQFDAFRFTRCGANDMSRSGFVNPLTNDSEGVLAYSASGFLVARIQTESKLLPSGVINAAVKERVEKLQTEQARKLKKTEKDSIKDEVLHTLIPRAFTASAFTTVLFDLKGNRIFINAGARKAENALAIVRKALSSLPVVPLTFESPIELTLTEWVSATSAPAGFAIGDRAELKALLEDGGHARLNKQDLTGDEVQSLLAAGKLVTRLALDWQERIQFVLNDGGQLTGVKFSDSLVEQNDDIDRDDELQRKSADVLLMGSELVALFDNLIVALGGEAKR